MLRHPDERAPTQVLRFDPRSQTRAGAADLRVQVYGNDGTQISAGTVAAPWRDEFLVGAAVRPQGAHLQTEPVKPHRHARGLRAGALLVSGAHQRRRRVARAAWHAGAARRRVAATWALVQFLSGVWAGVLGANSPFLHGLVAGVPALVLGLSIASPLPAQFVVVCWFLAPAAALLAAAIMRFVRHRK